MCRKLTNDRRKSKDKAKDHFNRNGKYNSKSIRQQERRKENSNKKKTN